MNSITIRQPDDFHCHMRDGEMMRLVAPLHRPFRRCLVMPNVPAIHTGEEAIAYRDRIEAVAGDSFKVISCVKLTHRTTPEMIKESKELDVLCSKLYPTGATHASDDGIGDPRRLAPVFEAMQSCGMVLCIHGEDPAKFVLDRESAYLDRVDWIVRNFPGLKVVLEHVTTGAAVNFVRTASVNLAATITAHHLVCTLDDVIGDGIRPHNYCKPVPKTPADRAELVTAAFWQNGGRFFLGTDSAPHARSAKESACGCAGVFSAPVAMSILAEVFLRDGPYPDAVRRLQAFTSERGADFYGLPRNTGTITLVREPWRVPDAYGDVVPFRAGETLDWRVEEPTDAR